MRHLGFALFALVAIFAVACSGGSDEGSGSGSEPSAAASDGSTSGDSIAAVVADAENNDEPTNDGSNNSDNTGGNGGTTANPPGGETVASTRATVAKIETPERKRIVAAMQSTEALESYEFAWDITLPTIPDVPGGLSLSGSGAMDPVNERFAMTMDFTEMFEALASAENATSEELELMQAFLGDDPMEIRYVDGVTYINWALFGMLFGAETPWIAIEDESSENAFDSVSGIGAGSLASPQDAVEFLRDTWGIEEIGRETVRGVDTTHYRGVIDFETLATDLSPEDVRDLEADLNGTDLSEVFGDFPIDVWIDDSDVMRRFAMEMDFTDFGSAGAAAEDVIGSMLMTYEFFNIGGDIVVVAPPADQVSDMADSFLDGFSLAS